MFCGDCCRVCYEYRDRTQSTGLTLVLTLTQSNDDETSRNTEISNSACLGGFCNRQKRLETYRPRLKIMVSPIRVRVPPLLPSRHLQGKCKLKRPSVFVPKTFLLQTVLQPILRSRR